MSNPSSSQDAERASLLAELAQVSGRDDIVEVMRRASNQDIRDDIADRRAALDDIGRHGRLGAIWKDDRASAAEA